MTSAKRQTRTHIVIPDTQVKPGVPTRHLGWIGRFVKDEYAGTNLAVIHVGDHYDMPSLSSYDKKGGRRMEGRRVKADLEAGDDAFWELSDPFADVVCERHFLPGNHEDRLDRAIEDNPQIDGVIPTIKELAPAQAGWTIHDYLEPVDIDGVVYSHYFYNPMTGRPYGGNNVETLLKNQGHSFTQGHRQTLLYGLRFVNGRSQHGLIAGSCYLHDEDYKGPQGNAHWRGIIVCHQVERGSYDPMFVSLDYLSRRYTGRRL